MPAKKTGKTAAKESDEEFLKRIMLKKEESVKKVSSEIGSSREAAEFREKGKAIGKNLEEIEECQKIIEEFKRNPPVMEAVEYNGVSFSYECKDAGVMKKIEFLKKHNFGFLEARKSTSTFTVVFKTFGGAYVRRGAQKIALPQTSAPAIVPNSNMGMGGGRALNPKDLSFILKDGDVIGTERGGYIYGISDVKQNMDNHNTDIIIFPESEMRIRISTETTYPEVGYMVPEKVSPAIKRESSDTVHSDTIEGIELIKGIFKISLLRKGMNVNGLIKFPSGCPQVEFEPTSKLMMKQVQAAAEKVKTGGPKIYGLLMANISAGRAASGVCDEMAAFIELNSDGSLVMFGTPNNIVHRGIGKETKKIDPRKKITVTQSALYETDCSTKKDPRADLIERKAMAITGYITIMTENKDFEERINAFEASLYKPTDPELVKRQIEDDKAMLKTAEELGDDDIIALMKQKIKDDSGLNKSKAERMTPEELEQMKSSLKQGREFYRKYKDTFSRDMEAPLPPYSAPNEGDKV